MRSKLSSYPKYTNIQSMTDLKRTLLLVLKRKKCYLPSRQYYCLAFCSRSWQAQYSFRCCLERIPPYSGNLRWSLSHRTHNRSDLCKSADTRFLQHIPYLPHRSLLLMFAKINGFYLISLIEKLALRFKFVTAICVHSPVRGPCLVEAFC